MIYDIQREYQNIEGYSPFSHINEVSPEYQKNSFRMPFVFRSLENRPIHPDTFADLGLKNAEITDEKIVFPTSSFRTVYDPEQNICYKVPLLRRITRGLRDLSAVELQRSQRASELLSKHKFEGFAFLEEECHPAEDPNFNYIKRIMPKKECFPWFYVIASQDFDKDFEIKTTERMIKSWIFLASKGIFLEYHTQNLLADNNSEIYYRDLSDVRACEDSVLRPSYADKKSGVEEILATVFDRALCNQNLDHLFRYDKRLGEKESRGIKDLIEHEIKKYNLPFPDYSMDFPKDKPERIPEKTKLVWWRDFR